SASVLDIFEPVLRRLFLIRAAVTKLALKLDPMPFERCCSLGEAGIAFNEDEYITRYLNKNAKLAELASLSQEIAALAAPAGSEPRLLMDGHDFVDLLTWFIRPHA